MPHVFRLIEAACATTVAAFARLVTGVRGEWRGCAPDPRRRVYFANHRSHADFVLIWTVLPAPLRRLTRPVAGADYWLKGGLRTFLGQRVFRAVLIDRNPVARDRDPIAIMAAALDQNSSLILFPEGTRNTSEEPLLPFKSGLYHLARARPDVELVPVWIEHVARLDQGVVGDGGQPCGPNRRRSAAAAGIASPLRTPGGVTVTRIIAIGDRDEDMRQFQTLGGYVGEADHSLPACVAGRLAQHYHAKIK